MALDLKEFIEHVVCSLVDDPSQIQVAEIIREEVHIYELCVAPEDVGRVIGRGGRTANALRSVLRAVSGRLGKRVSLEIVSPARKEVPDST